MTTFNFFKKAANWFRAKAVVLSDVTQEYRSNVCVLKA